jgi:2-dehydropantoate 2-reductase
MRILVVGAGAIGGYFGGRLAAAGQDVTFLVRARRAGELARDGLQISSPAGDVHIPSPKTVSAKDLKDHYDLVLLSCKAYDLEGAIHDFAPAVGPQTAILPLLNGMHHMDVLDRRFGAARVLGGLCMISTNLEAGGRVAHLNKLHILAYGERDGSHSPRVEAIAKAFVGANFVVRQTDAIQQEMWEKWVFIASCAGITCLMRSTIGDIVAAGGAEQCTSLLAECAAVAGSQGHPPSSASLELSRSVLTAAGSPLAASMWRDMERGAQIEAGHMIGDLLQRGAERKVPTPLLRVVYTHLRTYELRRERESAGNQG